MEQGAAVARRLGQLELGADARRVNVPIDVEAALRDGGAASIPMLIGSNLNEGVGFVSTAARATTTSR